MSLDVHSALEAVGAVDPGPAYGPTTRPGRRETDPGRRPMAAVAEPLSPASTLLSLAGDPAAVRPRLGAVAVTVDGGRYRVQVDLERDDDRAVGLGDGPLLMTVARRLVAEATLQALALLGVGTDRAAVDAVTVEALGSQTVALVTVLVAEGTYEEAHVGAAVVRAGAEHDAIARAALDATNRRLSTRA
ncbi:MAG: hypothetical protein NVSMB12_11160 [Acidimicrobiales bacterium]